jgi:hypothetical protein
VSATILPFDAARGRARTQRFNTTGHQEPVVLPAAAMRSEIAKIAVKLGELAGENPQPLQALGLIEAVVDGMLEALRR